MAVYDMSEGALRPETVRHTDSRYSREVEYVGWVPELEVALQPVASEVRATPAPALALEVEAILRRFAGS